MDPRCLQYALTEAERESFERDGYLIVKNALSPEHTAALIEVVDRLHAAGRLSPPGNAGIAGRINSLDFIGLDRALFDLVEYERTLPKVWGILGWNIFLYHSHLAITAQDEGIFDPNGPTFRWHQDSGRLNIELDTWPRPRISVKVAYFLTDVSESGRGNFWVIPGSHLKEQVDLPASGMGQPAGAEPVLVKPGMAAIFDRRLWHTATANYSPITRKVLFYGYAYRWIAARDDMTWPDEWYAEADPIRKQLLGHATSGQGRSSPKNEDVPLKVWLAEHQPEVIQRWDYKNDSLPLLTT